MQAAYQSGDYYPLDGRLYLIPRSAIQAARFDPASKEWETFGDIFPASEHTNGDKWSYCAISNFDQCIYSIPQIGPNAKACKILKIDPSQSTARMVGENVIPKGHDGIDFLWLGPVAGGAGELISRNFSGDSK